MTLEVSKPQRIQLLDSGVVSSLTTGLRVRSETQLDELILTVAKDDYRTLCERLFNAGFDFPASLTGVDMDWGLGVVLHVQQLESKRKVAVRVYTGYSDAHVPSVTDLWGGVDWHEREAYDLVGIHFDGHHDHRRILLEDHWTIHPLQRKYNTRGYVIPGWSAKPWPSPEPWEEGFTPFGAAAAPALHTAPAAKPAAPAPAVSSETAPAPSSAAVTTSVDVAPAAPAVEAPKKVAKKWVPKGAAETPAPPTAETAPAIPLSEPVTAPAPTVTSSAPDDLKRLEGIGPKMNDALVAAGLDSFAKLAASNQGSLRAAIEAAGLSFAPSMDSWIEQAGLLARGDEAGFKALTDRLTAGRTDAPVSSTTVESPVSSGLASGVPVSSAATAETVTPPAPAAETGDEEKPRNPKIKRWNPNG